MAQQDGASARDDRPILPGWVGRTPRMFMAITLVLVAVPVALAAAPAAPVQAAIPAQCASPQAVLWQLQRPISEDDTFSRTNPNQRGQNWNGTFAPAETALAEPDYAGLSVAAPGVMWNDYLYFKSDQSDKQEAADIGTALVILATPPQHAQSFTLNADGSFRYVPRFGYFGSDSFEYVLALGSGGGTAATVCSSPSRVTIQQTGLPYPRSDRYTVYGGETLSFAGVPCGLYCGVLDGDLNLPTPIPGFAEAWAKGISNSSGGGRAVGWFDNGGAPLAGQFGSITDFNRNGTFTYVPNPGAVGIDTFTYDMTRTLFESRDFRATITIDVRAAVPVQVPVGTDDVVAATEDAGAVAISAATLRANDARAIYIPYVGTNAFRATTFDTGNGTLSIAYTQIFPDASSDDSHASTITYTPNPNFRGVDRFQYWVATQYPWNTSAVPVTVYVNVASVPDAPIARADASQTLEDQSIVIDLVANDTDGDGDLNPESIVALGQVCPPNCRSGTWTLQPGGTVLYVPTPDFVGLASFRYRISDFTGRSGEATAVVTVAVDDAVDDAFAVPEDGVLQVPAPGLAANDDGVVGLPIVFLMATTTNGLLEITSNTGAFRYTPAAGYVGTDTFRYVYTNAARTAFSDEATVTIDVTPVNDAPAVTLQQGCLTGDLCLFGQLRDVTEGGQITVSGYVNDVEFDPGTVSIAWGDGTTTGPATYPCEAPCAFSVTPTFTEPVPCLVPPGGAAGTCPTRQYFAFTHTYVDDPTTSGDLYPITVTANDGATRVVTTQARVRNIAPTLTVTSANPAAFPTVPVTVSGTVTDPADPRTLQVNWGDGSAPVPVPLSCGIFAGSACSFSVQRAYTATGSYTITLTAMDDDGGTDVETRVATITAAPGVVPAAPTAVAGTSGDGQVVVRWTAPAPNTGAAPSDYVIEVSTDGGTTWAPFADGASSATSATVTGLTNGTPHRFRVRAVNAAGAGQFSAPSSPVVPVPVPTPTELAALPPTLGVPDATPARGATFRIEQGGFTPGEPVLVVIESTPRVLASTTADGSGAVSVDVTIPNDLALGGHTLSVVGGLSRTGTKAFITVVAVDDGSTGGSGFVPVVPVRVFDTRPGEPQGIVPITQQQYGGTNVLRIKITDTGNIPATGVAAVSLNVTAVNPTGPGFVTVYPCGDIPRSSNINYTTGQVIPNAVIAPISPTGEICFSSLANTHLIADINGWFATGP